MEDQSDVRLEHVAKRFGDVVAVDDLSLEIAKGEFFSLLGPSGCGKTTTLRMIGGFEEPTAGTVYLANQDVTNLPPYRRAVNTVFQSYALFPHLDVFENVAFGLRRRKVGRSEAAVRVREVLRLVDLAGFERRRPTQLSGGQQQRVALARALVNEPMVLLLDEPLGALDLKLRKQMQLELKRIQREVQLTFLYVTHDQEEAMTMSDHLAVMRRGRIEQIGKPEDVYESPATEFVAGFLGASNLLDGTVQDGPGDPAAVRLADGTVVRAPRARLHGLGSRVRVGVRPEKIHLSRAGGSGGEPPRPDGWNELQGTVRAAAYIGVSYQYVMDGPGGTTLTVYAQNLGNQDAPAPGGLATLRWRPEHTFAIPMAAERGEEDEER